MEGSWKGRLLLRVADWLFRLLNLFFHGLLSVIYKGPGERLPPIDNLILLDSATTLASKIRSQKLTSVEVVQSFIDRIKAVNGILNTVVDNRFEDALNDARKADDIVKNSGKTKEELAAQYPFLGVPFTVKDCISIEGLSFTGGLYYRKDLKASEDADNVTQFKRAGAIPLAVTNVSELCLWWESWNKVYGRTCNPYNTNHIVGGSSGGEGCIQAAAGSPMGIGSDIAGSIRIPAFFNGIFGHKPTTGIGSHKGHYPVPDGALQLTFLVSGPLSRFATDLRPMLKVLAPTQVEKLKLNEKVDITKIKFFYMEDDEGGLLVSPVELEIKEIIRKVVAYLKKRHGIVANRVSLSAMKNSMTMWFAKMKTSGEPQLLRELGNNEKIVNPYWEILKLMVGASKHTLPILAAGALEQLGLKYGGPQHVNLLNQAEDLKIRFENMLGTDGVFLYPTHPTAAPYHVEPLVKPFNVGYTAVFNILGLPSTHCPMGLNKNGLPIGIQVVGGIYQDRLTLAVAEELERAFGGWVPPSMTV